LHAKKGDVCLIWKVLKKDLKLKKARSRKAASVDTEDWVIVNNKK